MIFLIDQYTIAVGIGQIGIRSLHSRHKHIVKYNSNRHFGCSGISLQGSQRVVGSGHDRQRETGIAGLVAVIAIERSLNGRCTGGQQVDDRAVDSSHIGIRTGPLNRTTDGRTIGHHRGRRQRDLLAHHARRCIVAQFNGSSHAGIDSRTRLLVELNGLLPTLIITETILVAGSIKS